MIKLSDASESLTLFHIIFLLVTIKNDCGQDINKKSYRIFHRILWTLSKKFSFRSPPGRSVQSAGRFTSSQIHRTDQCLISASFHHTVASYLHRFTARFFILALFDHTAKFISQEFHRMATSYAPYFSFTPFHHTVASFDHRFTFSLTHYSAALCDQFLISVSFYCRVASCEHRFNFFTS